MADQSSKIIHWNPRLEEYFCHTGEKAHCLSWLHKKSEELYSGRTIFIDLPVIILGTLNGAISVGSNSLFGGSEYASVGVGAVALLTAILSTVGSYFSWSRRAEGHRISSLNYAKLYRFLSVEMALPRDERMTPTDLLKYVKTEYDRLSEISPLLPASVIELFKARFDKPEYEGISKPEDTNGLHPIIVFERDDTHIKVPKDIYRFENSSTEISGGALLPVKDFSPVATNTVSAATTATTVINAVTNTAAKEDGDADADLKAENIVVAP